MRIDLHLYARERSPCACSSAEEMIHAAIDRELEALVISCYDRLMPLELLSARNARYAPFRVFGGVEITLARERALVLGVQDDLLERGWWTSTALCMPSSRGRAGFWRSPIPFA